MGTQTNHLRKEALFTAILLAIALAFSVAFTVPGAAGADEGDPQDSGLTAQADSVSYDLKVTNDEGMYVVVKATLVDGTDQDYLEFYLNSTTYKYVFSGSQDDAYATYNDGNPKDSRWSKYEQKTISSTYVNNKGTDVTITDASKYGFKIPVAIPAGETKFTIPVAAKGETDFTARCFEIDLDAKTAKTGTAHDVATVAIESSPADIKASSGSIDYTGYVSPAAGHQAETGTCLSNNWTSELTVNLGSGNIYDEAYAITYQGRPKLTGDEPVKDVADSDKATVSDKGVLVLPVKNSYVGKNDSGNSVQLNGNIIKVMMHVKADAGFAEKDTWVERTFQLDFTSRTNANLTITGDALTPVPQAMHRLYNPNSGEHFYTASDDERDYLVSLGWNSEGDGWTAPTTSNTPVYRLYNPNAGEHHYTMSIAERDHLVSVGWNYENIGWYSDDAQTVPLYRVYNPNAFANNHHYTTSAAERDWLVSLGWNDEDKAWYGLK